MPGTRRAKPATPEKTKVSLFSVNCSVGHMLFRDQLIHLYGELEKIEAGTRPFGGFETRETLSNKYRFNAEKYPSLDGFFVGTEIGQVHRFASMSFAEMLRVASTPLEKLAIAALWKKNDLGKIKHIAAGMSEPVDLTDDRDIEQEAPVFRQLGRHLANPRMQPIADQHTVRSYRYLVHRNLSDESHTEDTVKATEVRDYARWFRKLSDSCIFKPADADYRFDISMYELGKATKAFINRTVSKKSRTKLP